MGVRGGFGSGLAQGLTTGASLARMYTRDEVDRELLKEFRDKRAANASILDAVKGGVSAAQSEASAANESTVGKDYSQPASNVPGVGVTTDPEFAKSQAADQEFITGQKTEPTPGVYAKGLGFYQDTGTAESQAQSQDLAPGKPAPKVDWEEVFQRKYAPQVKAAYMSAGKIDEAEKFDKLMQSDHGRRYGSMWSEGMAKLASGDSMGALGAMEKLYNSDAYPDGNYATFIPGGRDAKGQMTFTARIKRRNDDSIVNEYSGTANDLANMGLRALEPAKQVETLMSMESKRAERDAQHQGKLGEIAVKAGYDQQLAETKAGLKPPEAKTVGDDLMERQDDGSWKKVATGSRAPKANGGLTVPQQRTNDSINAARKRLSGMSASDVLAKTQSTTATGRQNDQYDPELARLANLARSRLYGEDPAHDEFTANTRQPSQTSNDVTKRFGADVAMRDKRLGKTTPSGVEVLDKSGKIIGYYR